MVKWKLDRTITGKRVAICIITSVGITFFGFLYSLVEKGLLSEITAAWVQAGGSVVAIWAAIGIAWWQNEKQRTDQEREKAQQDDGRILQFHLATVFFVNRLEGLKKYLELRSEVEPFVYDEPSFDDVRMMLREVDLSKLDNWTIAKMFVVRSAMSEVHTRFSKNSNELRMGMHAEDMAWIDDLMERVRIMVQENEKVLDRRGIEIPDGFR